MYCRFSMDPFVLKHFANAFLLWNLPKLPCSQMDKISLCLLWTLKAFCHFHVSRSCFQHLLCSCTVLSPRETKESKRHSSLSHCKGRYIYKNYVQTKCMQDKLEVTSAGKTLTFRWIVKGVTSAEAWRKSRKPGGRGGDRESSRHEDNGEDPGSWEMHQLLERQDCTVHIFDLSTVVYT